MDKWHLPVAVAMAAATLFGLSSPAGAADVDNQRLVDADKTPADWLTYHGTYKSWHYSGLDQINAGNVKNLEGRMDPRTPDARRAACRSTPLAADGVLYYSGSYSQRLRARRRDRRGDLGLHAEARRGPGLQADALALQPRHRHRPRQCLRRHASTGELIAHRHEDRQAAWETKLVDSQEADRRLHRRAAVRQGQGDHRLAGRRMAVPRPDLRRRRQDRQEDMGVLHRRRHRRERRRARPGATTPGRPAAAAAGCPAATTRRPTRCGGAPPTRRRCTTGRGADWKTEGARPGDNLYTTSVIALDPDTGKLKFYHQELPHDAWDFDSAVGEFVMLERDGKKLRRAPQQGRLRLRLRPRSAKIENVWQRREEHQLRQGHRSEDRRADRSPRPAPKASTSRCARHRRRHQLERGHLQPEDRACTTRSATSGAWTSKS